MPDHIVETSAGPVIVYATEPVPGLHVYEIPEDVSVQSPYRWILAHHQGRALASFETGPAAIAAAEKVAPLADWTRTAITVANQIGPGRTEELLSTLQTAGGQHPNA